MEDCTVHPQSNLFRSFEHKDFFESVFIVVCPIRDVMLAQDSLTAEMEVFNAMSYTQGSIAASMLNTAMHNNLLTCLGIYLQVWFYFQISYLLVYAFFFTHLAQKSNFNILNSNYDASFCLARTGQSNLVPSQNVCSLF